MKRSESQFEHLTQRHSAAAGEQIRRVGMFGVCQGLFARGWVFSSVFLGVCWVGGCWVFFGLFCVFLVSWVVPRFHLVFPRFSLGVAWVLPALSLVVVGVFPDLSVVPNCPLVFPVRVVSGCSSSLFMVVGKHVAFLLMV